MCPKFCHLLKHLCCLIPLFSQATLSHLLSIQWVSAAEALVMDVVNSSSSGDVLLDREVAVQVVEAGAAVSSATRRSLKLLVELRLKPSAPSKVLSIKIIHFLWVYALSWLFSSKTYLCFWKLSVAPNLDFHSISVLYMILFWEVWFSLGITDIPYWALVFEIHKVVFSNENLNYFIII